ncbi:hypothetical protein KSF78_0005582 [Schistosoma japonicum]|nr:hypothetical protein KSF78_0005582 [Schistosoma japonicum]
MRSDGVSALQINFPYDVNETQVEEKPPVPSTTFGSNVYPGLMKKRIGVYRYNRIPASYYNSIQKYNRILNAQTYQPSTVFVFDCQGTDNLNVSNAEQQPNQLHSTKWQMNNFEFVTTLQKMKSDDIS